ncbi:HK97 gp10 family phage protein [Brevibacillus laterosporus]|nr:HK97 gp10 family phage protein [Brevibacillus laterosporus]MDO0940543.1 HK97 gp10 family phage protein [Brevibacillus laterosporus]
MDEWKVESVDVAPLDKDTLRRGISTEVRQKNGEVSGEISAVAIETTPKWPNFNYACYIHEVKGDIKNPTTPGTVAKFIDAPADERKQKWLKDIEDGVKAEVQKLGF